MRDLSVSYNSTRVSYFLYISTFRILSTHLTVRGGYTLHIDLQIFPEAGFGLYSLKKSFGFSAM